MLNMKLALLLILIGLFLTIMGIVAGDSKSYNTREEIQTVFFEFKTTYEDAMAVARLQTD